MYLFTVTLFNLQSTYSTLKIAIGSYALPRNEITVTTAHLINQILKPHILKQQLLKHLLLKQK